MPGLYLHLGDGSLWRVVEVAKGIELPAQLAEEVLEFVLEVLLRVVLCYPHGLLQELHRGDSPTDGRRGSIDVQHTYVDGVANCQRSARKAGQQYTAVGDAIVESNCITSTHSTPPSLHAEVLKIGGDLNMQKIELSGGEGG